MSAPVQPPSATFSQNKVSAAVWPWATSTAPSSGSRHLGRLFVQAAVGLALAALLAFVLHFRHAGLVAATATTVLLVLGLLAPGLHAGLIGGVLRGVNAIGAGLTAVLLPALFFTLFLLIGVLRRIAGNDSMSRAFPPPPGSLWTPRRAPQSNDEYLRQF